MAYLACVWRSTARRIATACTRRPLRAQCQSPCDGIHDGNALKGGAAMSTKFTVTGSEQLDAEIIARQQRRRIGLAGRCCRSPGYHTQRPACHCRDLPEEVPACTGSDPGAFAAAIVVNNARATRLETATDDDGRHYRTCQQLAGSRCRAHGFLVMDDIPRRCFDYQPQPGDHDQRPGSARWPPLNPETAT